jgi:hypothetical protein
VIVTAPAAGDSLAERRSRLAEAGATETGS